MQLKECHFHPYEIAFCGFSNSGKTTLIAKIINELSGKYHIGFIKNDSHHFEMDKEGKDTATMYTNGAHQVFISDPQHYAMITQGEFSQFDLKERFIDCDFVLIEGHKKSKTPKFVFIGENENKLKTIEKFNNNEYANILGFIGNNESDRFTNDLPFFTRNETDNIIKFIINRFDQIFENTPLYGIVLTGGKSSRMGSDKSALNYHKISQVQYSIELLNEFCEQSFVSCRVEQKDLPHFKNFNQIHDSFPSIGPTSGILSAMYHGENAAWLVLACDLPYLNRETIADLIKNRNPFKNATCYLNPKRGWPEPLCTIYEPKARIKLMQFFAQSRPCPRKVLFNSQIKALELDNKYALENANTPKDYEEAIKNLNTER